MDFLSIVLFLVIFYIRPQEWIDFLSFLHPVTLIMSLAALALMLRPSGFSFRTLLKTPHDWMMLLYFLWIVGTAPDRQETFAAVRNLFFFYIVIVQALNSMDRVQKYCQWWTAMIFLIALLAVASEFGFDPMGTYDKTHGGARDRLVLNNTMFDNPNALGHSVIVVVPMIYFLLVWKRPIFVKEAALPLLALPLACVYMTQSKGSFVSGFVAVLAAATFGRPKFVQVVILVLALTVGWGALYQLPRMPQLNRARADEGIASRMRVFDLGYRTLKTERTGVGWGGFQTAHFKRYGFYFASHGAYNQVGTELGYTGLFLFIGIIYCCMRTLIVARTATDDEERARRVLFVLIVSYAVSGWMIDFGMRATFWMTAAAIAAFHRQLQQRTDGEKPSKAGESEASEALQPAMPWLRPAPVPALAVAPMSRTSAVLVPGRFGPFLPGPAAQADGTPVPPAITWRRLGLLDFAMMWGLTEFCVWLWDYVLKNLWN